MTDELEQPVRVRLRRRSAWPALPPSERGRDMVRITRLNDTVLVVNADLIEFLEATPDTIVTLTTGRKVIAKESIDELIDKVVAYKRRFLQPTPEVRPR